MVTEIRHLGRWKQFFGFLGLCFAGFLAEAAPDTVSPKVFLLDAQFLQASRQKLSAGDQSLAPALAELERDAQDALRAGPYSVTTKKVVPPSGDKHDYMSEAPYFWPNPKTTNGLPYIRRDGERNPEINHITDHRSLDQMAGSVETLGLAYYFKGDEAYAAKAAKLLRAWFFDPATRMNPNLQYAQAVLGVNTGRGTGLIESRGLTRVVDAVGVLEGSKSWTADDQRRLQDWFAAFLKWMQESKNGRDECAAKNNHGTYYDIQAASFALFLGKTDLAAETIRSAKDKRIAVQIEPDGREPLELVRTRAWGYSVGNLAGLMALAKLGEVVKVDLWHYETSDGRSIRKALDYLAPYGLGQAKWPYQQIGGWPPQMIYPLLRQAALQFPEPRYHDWLKQVPLIEASNRSNLLRPKPSEAVEVHE